ncbi:DUF6783 domain-containing protein [Hungatella sp.]|uniref:DUF6783 domain-containing protein n=1 Tax=Hungatella sp. TaxID=2613924 RepID=UPI002A81C83A|nr:DUF6783 domain-containing protein [Hungatella sp.]
MSAICEPLRGIFGPNLDSVAHYASFMGTKSPTKCDAQLTIRNFQTHSRVRRQATDQEDK